MWRVPPRLGRATPLNVVFDGNSLVQGVGFGASDAAHTFPGQTLALLRQRFTDVIATNRGISGQTWRNMDGLDGYPSDGGGDVDAAWDPARANVLVLWETTNAVCNAGRSAAQAAGDAQAYIASRRRAHPGWRIVALGSIPRQTGPAFGSGGQAAVDAFNATLTAADALIATGLRSWGGHAFVPLRGAGSPFRLPDYAAASFAWNDGLWNETAGGRVHLSDAGYAIVAGLVARAIANLGAR